MLDTADLTSHDSDARDRTLCLPVDSITMLSPPKCGCCCLRIGAAMRGGRNTRVEEETQSRDGLDARLSAATHALLGT